ncbi:hypothetical protein RB653_001674 [Dictyostelium firmibasis]|uniref:Uncharacterized protein n=1 Tax=Dictyostelium firmibasis TaxID=79012 RepID=A0AAN7U4G5_9MYCE
MKFLIINIIILKIIFSSPINITTADQGYIEKFTFFEGRLSTFEYSFNCNVYIDVRMCTFIPDYMFKYQLFENVITSITDNSSSLFFPEPLIWPPLKPPTKGGKVYSNATYFF